MPLFAAAVLAALVAAVVLGSPEPVVELLERRTEGVLFSVDVDERVVALTIDDGPSPETHRILDVLREHGARATFFLIGEHVDAHPDGAWRAVAEGHEVANHMLADEPSVSLPPGTFEEHLLATERRLTPLGGARLLRPGSGWVDQRMVAQAARHGYRVVLGSVYPFDAAVPVPPLLSWYVLRNVSPGSIVVLHEGRGRGKRTAEVLEEVLPELRARGYRVVTVSELLDVGARATSSPAPPPSR